MRRHADLVQRVKMNSENAVVEDTLALDRGAFLIVEGGRIVLEVLDERARLRALVKHLGLAFVNASAPLMS